MKGCQRKGGGFWFLAIPIISSSKFSLLEKYCYVFPKYEVVSPGEMGHFPVRHSVVTSQCSHWSGAKEKLSPHSAFAGSPLVLQVTPGFNSFKVFSSSCLSLYNPGVFICLLSVSR